MLPTARGPPWRPSVRPGVDLRSLLLPLDAAGLGIWREMVQACVAGAEGGECDHVDGCQGPPTPTKRGGLGKCPMVYNYRALICLVVGGSKQRFAGDCSWGRGNLFARGR